MPNLLSAASSSVYGFLLQASQASDVGSIPIARSIIRKIHVDSAALTRWQSLNLRLEAGVLRPFCAQGSPEDTGVFPRLLILPRLGYN